MRLQLGRLRLTVIRRLLPLVLVSLCLASLPACSDGSAEPKAPKRTAPPTPSNRPTVKGKPLSRVATDEENHLWKRRGCVGCHGKDGEGSSMGPALHDIVPLYLKSEGSDEAAVARLTRYIIAPTSEPLLGGSHGFRIPMPNIGAVQGTDAEAALLAGLLVRWQQSE